MTRADRAFGECGLDPSGAGEFEKGGPRPAPAPVIEDAPLCGPGSAKPRFPDDDGMRVLHAPLSSSPPAFLHLPFGVPPRIEGSSLIGPFAISILCLREHPNSAKQALAMRPCCRRSLHKRSARVL